MINAEFKEKYRPLARKEEDEYWLQMEDFRCNFGGLIIISAPEPYSQEGLNVKRCYHTPSGGVSVQRARYDVTASQTSGQYKKPSAPYLGNVMNRDNDATSSSSSRVSPLLPVSSRTTVNVAEFSGECLDTDVDGEVLVFELDSGVETETTETEELEEEDDLFVKSSVSVAGNNQGAGESVERLLSSPAMCHTPPLSPQTGSDADRKTDDADKVERMYSNFVVEKRKTCSTDSGDHLDSTPDHSDACVVRTHPGNKSILNGVKGQAHSSVVSKLSPRFLRRKKTGVAKTCYPPSNNNGYISDSGVQRCVEGAFVGGARKASDACTANPESKSCVSNKYNHATRSSRDAPAKHVTSRHQRRTEKSQPPVPNLRKSNYDQYFARKISLPHLSNTTFHLPSKCGGNNASRRSSTPQNAEFPGRRRIDSATSVHSDARSCYSASEISIHIRSQLSIDDTGRPMSAPLHRNLSTGSLNSLTQSNFLATKADYFKAHSRWSCIVDHKGKWTSTYAQ